MNEEQHSDASSSTQATFSPEQLSASAQRIVALAQEEAKAFFHNYVGTEHLLLGILADEDNLGARLLSNFGVEASRVRQAIEVIVGRGPHPVEGSIEMTPRALAALALAAEEAQRVQQQTISSEHILFGIVSLREGLAARILETLGPKGEKVRARISMALSGAERPGESTAPKGNVVTCRLTDHDLNALDALIEAGIRSTRSDAAAWLIHAGIEANQPLLEKVYGTVAEIRRLRSIAQALVQPTQPDEQKTASNDKGEARS